VTPVAGAASRAATLASELSVRLRHDQIITDPTELRTYECDGLTSHRARPILVALPETTEEVQAVVTVCARHDVPFVSRGAGTGLSGGAMPEADGVVIALTRMRRILSIDPANRQMTVEAGVTNLEITQAAAPHGLYFAPDPSSQVVCTLGGNIAENSGGAHCLKYGFTSNHVLALTVVLPDGSLVELGDGLAESPGYDLRGYFVGSEGTLGVACAATVGLLRRPEAVETMMVDFRTPVAAGEAVGAVIAAGIVPAAMEMLDALAVEACELAVGAGFSREAGAVLLVEVDGTRLECDGILAEVVALCRGAGATAVKVAADEAERARMWAGRKAAFAAMGRLSPAFLIQDGVIPRTALAGVLAEIASLAAGAGLRVANVFHAGDGNLHPLVLYDPAMAGEPERAEELSKSIVTACVAAGGSITGEHGVGVDKACAMPLQFGADDLAVMRRLRDAFDPAGICNPGKVFPTPRLCGERPGPYRPHLLEEAGVISRW
jgi:glycolate oxidase